MTDDNKRAIMQAFKQGAQIESRLRYSVRPWQPCPQPSWYWAHWEYRLASEQQSDALTQRRP